MVVYDVCEYGGGAALSVAVDAVEYVHDYRNGRIERPFALEYAAEHAAHVAHAGAAHIAYVSDTRQARVAESILCESVAVALDAYAAEGRHHG